MSNKTIMLGIIAVLLGVMAIPLGFVGWGSAFLGIPSILLGVYVLIRGKENWSRILGVLAITFSAIAMLITATLLAMIRSLPQFPGG